jgi:hypothetical protein
MLKQTLFCIGLVASAFAGPVSASEFGSPEEAKAMLARAILEVKADKPGAIAKFNRNDPQVRDRDLFVFCFNTQDGIFTAHEAMVGWDVRKLRDSSGRSFGEQMYQTAKEGQITEVAFISPIPGSTEHAPRHSYVTRIGDQVCGVSAYRHNAPANPTQ